MALVHVLTVLLGDEADLRAYAERTDGKVEWLRQDRQSLPGQLKEMAGSAVGHGTGLFRR